MDPLKLNAAEELAGVVEAYLFHAVKPEDRVIRRAWQTYVSTDPILGKDEDIEDLFVVADMIREHGKQGCDHEVIGADCYDELAANIINILNHRRESR